MQFRLSLIFGTLAASTLAFGQLGANVTAANPYTDSFQVGYAANLLPGSSFGDSILNLSNSGFQGPFLAYPGYPFPPTTGDICVNVYVMAPDEQQIACCSCLVSPNAVIGLSAIHDLINNPLTPVTPTSVVIKLVASQPATNTGGQYTVCNAGQLPIPAAGTTGAASVPYGGASALESPSGVKVLPSPTGSLAGGMIAWGTTIEPSINWMGPGDGLSSHYSVVPVDYKKEALSSAELSSLVSTCNFIQADGSTHGICGSQTALASTPCAPGGQIGALTGAKN